jgi:acrylyl-CoA reductase (NADPH)
MDFPASMAPFILRGVTLAGIDSVMAAMPLRQTAWNRLAQDLAPDRLQAITREIRLAEAIDAGHRIMEGGMRGRVVVDVNA